MDVNQIIVILFGVLYFGYILWTRRRSDFEEFSVANRNLGVWIVFMSVAASYTGPAATLGLARDGFSNGNYLLGIGILGGIGMILVAFFIAPKVRDKFADSNSLGSIVGGPTTHNNRLVKISIGFTSLMVMSAIAIVMSYAGGELIQNVFGYSKVWSIVIITSIVTVYSAFGGIRASIHTDAFQFLHFIILVPLLALLIFMDSDFEWQAYRSHTKLLTTDAFSLSSFSNTLGLAMLFFIMNAGVDAPILNRMLASKSARVARKALFLGGLFTIFWTVIMVFIGSSGSFLHPDLVADDQVLLNIGAHYYPNFLYGIFIIAMLGIVMSTQDTLLNAAAILFGEDVLGGFDPELSDQRKLIYSKGFTFLLGFISILVASTLSSVLHSIVSIASYYIPVLIPVTLFSILKENHFWQSAIVSMIAGFLSYLAWDLIDVTILPSILVGLAGSTLAYLIADWYIANHTKVTSSPTL